MSLALTKTECRTSPHNTDSIKSFFPLGVICTTETNQEILTTCLNIALSLIYIIYCASVSNVVASAPPHP